MIFDTHAHYDDDAFEDDRDKILNILAKEGINPIVNIGASIKSSKQSLELAKNYDHVYAAIGVHPEACDRIDKKDIEWLEECCKYDKVVAIGEIGLDYHYDEPAREIQQKWFIEQLLLAKRVNLPVVIHSRDAAKDTFDILSREEFRDLSGIIHCFSYSREVALSYVEMGYYIGVGGVVTFKNGRKLREAVESIPLERIVLETDCPYLSPEPYRGRRNSSVYLTYVVDKIAEIKGVSAEEVMKITYENACRVYRIK